MENYDCSRLYVWDNIAGAGVSAYVAVVVAADYVPHYVIIPFIEHPCLVWAYTGIWRAEKVGFYHVSGNVYVPYIISCFHSPSLYVAVGVVAYCVAAPFYLFKQLREHFNILSYAEKGCLCVVFVQKVKHPWGNLRPWTVIESKENTVLFVGKIPDECRKQFPDDFWRFYSHNCNVWIGKSNNKKLPL